jgi:hypothetical protein
MLHENMDTFSPNTIESQLARLSVYSDAPVSVEKRADAVLEQIRRELTALAPHVKTHLVLQRVGSYVQTMMEKAGTEGLACRAYGVSA